MAEDTRGKSGGSVLSPGPHLAKVVSHLDSTYMGSLEVELLDSVGSYDSRSTQLYPVKYISPFTGATSERHLSQTNDYNGTQKSYGMWMIPPDPGNIVVVIFINGDPTKGYWFGCIHPEDMNFQVPGYAATQYNTTNANKRLPVAEYNKKALAVCAPDTTKNRKATTPLATALEKQGLVVDDNRGITSSSARRDLPSAVFGVSTPGPIDHKGPSGNVGKFESKVAAAKVSRLGGSSFVMDDGDDKWVRKTTPSEGPPEYANKENDEKGLDEIPHNELIRIRTRTGHQILLHNSEDLIYIGNARGTAWIELTSDGKMDVYCEDSISFRTKADFNFYANRDVNIEAGRNVNIKSGAETRIETVTDYSIKVGNRGLLTLAKDYEINSGGKILETSAGSNETKAGGNIIETAPQIHMNGPSAGTASKVESLKEHTLPDLSAAGATPSDRSTIMRRMPTPEPYPHHENLEPKKFKRDKTDRDADGRTGSASTTLKAPAEWYKKYSTSTDTFAKVGKKKA